jgi:hypothetical protein
MDISKQFSFTDFLAYFFPGSFSILGICCLLVLTPAQPILASMPVDIATGIAFLIVSYIVGVILSGFSSVLVSQIVKLTKMKDVKNLIPNNIIKDEIVSAFCDVFGKIEEKDVKWSIYHYGLCRSLITEKMPAIAQRIDRSNNLVLFRRNLVLPILIWMCAGIGWGVWVINSGFKNWGISLVIVSVVICISAIRSTIQRMHNSEEAVIRDALNGFLAGYKIGLFKKSSKE